MGLKSEAFLLKNKLKSSNNKIYNFMGLLSMAERGFLRKAVIEKQNSILIKQWQDSGKFISLETISISWEAALLRLCNIKDRFFNITFFNNK